MTLNFMIMKKILTLLVLIHCSLTLSAQEYFSGKLKARSYEYHNKMMILASRGMLMNGARDAEMYVDGRRLASYDMLANIRTVYDLDAGKVFFVFNELKTVVIMPSDVIVQMNNSKAALKAEPTDEYVEILGLKCRKYRGDIYDATTRASVSSETWVCEDLKVHPDLTPYISGNTGVANVGMKYFVKSVSAAGALGKATMSIAYDIKEIDRDFKDESVFEIPKGYVQVPYSRMHEVYKENQMTLEKSKKLPKKKPVEITFDIDEEFDF